MVSWLVIGLVMALPSASRPSRKLYDWVGVWGSPPLRYCMNEVAPRAKSEPPVLTTLKRS